MPDEHYQSFLLHLYGHSTNIIDNEYVTPKSISQETTLNYDIDIEEMIIEFMEQLIDDIVEKLIKPQLFPKTIGYKLKTNTFKLQTKSYTLLKPTQDLNEIKEGIKDLFINHYDHTPIRLIGVYVSNLDEDHTPFNLFTYHLFHQHP